MQALLPTGSKVQLARQRSLGQRAIPNVDGGDSTEIFRLGGAHRHEGPQITMQQQLARLDGLEGILPSRSSPPDCADPSAFLPLASWGRKTKSWGHWPLALSSWPRHLPPPCDVIQSSGLRTLQDRPLLLVGVGMQIVRCPVAPAGSSRAP